MLEKLGQNSRNSHKPPSSDPPGVGPQRKSKGKKGKRGGQRGHRGAFRELLPASQVDEVVNLFPPQCENCWVAVKDADVKHTDGTSWLQAGAVMCLWTVATATATAFKVLAHGSKSALLPLFGKLCSQVCATGSASASLTRASIALMAPSDSRTPRTSSSS